jgi:hypothetical protein
MDSVVATGEEDDCASERALMDCGRTVCVSRRPPEGHGREQEAVGIVADAKSPRQGGRLHALLGRMADRAILDAGVAEGGVRFRVGLQHDGECSRRDAYAQSGSPH